jgi:hypothetical protein
MEKHMAVNPMTRPALYLLLLLATLPGASLLAQTSPTLQRASCVLRIDDGERFGPATASAQAVSAALTSTALIDPAMEAALKLPASDWPTVAQVEVQPAGESAVKLTITIKPDDRHILPPGAARLVLDEITTRALRSFNGTDSRDDSSENLIRLRKQRADLDVKLNALRTELDAAMQLSNRRDNGNRLMLQAQLEQQITEARIDIAVQTAAIKTINEQLPTIEKENDPELKALRARFIGQRIDAQIAVAKAEARAAELRNRLSEVAEDRATTQPVRSIMTIQSEQSESMNQRQMLDQQISQLMNDRTNRPTKGKLVVIDGGAK